MCMRNAGMQHVSMTRIASNTELVTSSAQYHMAALIFILMFYKNNLIFHSHRTNYSCSLYYCSYRPLAFHACLQECTQTRSNETETNRPSITVIPQIYNLLQLKSLLFLFYDTVFKKYPRLYTVSTTIISTFSITLRRTTRVVTFSSSSATPSFSPNSRSSRV